MSLKIWVNIEIGKYNGQNMDQSFNDSDNRINDLLGNITDSQADRLDMSGISGNDSFIQRAGDMTNVTMFQSELNQSTFSDTTRVSVVNNDMRRSLLEAKKQIKMLERQQASQQSTAANSSVGFDKE